MSKLYDFLNAIVSKLNGCVKTEAQTLTEAQKAQARKNIGAAEEGNTGGSPDAVLYTEQTLTEEQKKQARKNIGAVPAVVEGGGTLTWDGNTEGRYIAADTFVHISDVTPTMADLSNGWCFCGLEFSATQAVELEGAILAGSDIETFMIVPRDGMELDGMFVEKKGIYVMTMLPQAYPEIYITIPGYTGFGKEVIDTKYLPEHLQFGEKEVVVVDEQTFMPSADGVALECAQTPSLNTEVKIVFDGESYTYPVGEFFGEPCAGNLDIVFGEEGNGEPCFVMWTDGVCAVMTLDQTTSHTIEITGVVITKLPDKYCDTKVSYFVKTSASDHYIYKDLAFLQKVTRDELHEAFCSKIVTLDVRNEVSSVEFIGLVKPFYFTYSSDTEAAIVHAHKEDGTVAQYYTAEYTPTT